jgi:hypothetical protein
MNEELLKEDNDIENREAFDSLDKEHQVAFAKMDDVHLTTFTNMVDKIRVY